MWYLFTVALLTVWVVKIQQEESTTGREQSGHALVRCRGASAKSCRLASSVKSCALAAAEFPDYSLCPEGCIGLYSCRRVCSSGALDEEFNVDLSRCISCGRCLEVCPKGLIELRENHKPPFVRCFSSLQPGRLEEKCNNGCWKCYKCLDICPEKAVYVSQKGIPLTDMSKCRLCERCIRECPSGARKMIND